MDVFAKYNQIQRDPKDEEKTVFIIKKSLYYYMVMPSRLKNAEITYQCLVNKAFKDQISWNMKVYANNMLVKSKEVDCHINILE